MVINDFDGDNDAMGIIGNENLKMEDAVSPSVSDSDAGSVSGREDDSHVDDDFKFFLVVDKIELKEIKMNEPVLISGFTKWLEVHVYWPDKMIGKYDIESLSSLPKVFRPLPFTWMPQESISLYKCLEGFLQEEPLGPDDMWSVCSYFNMSF